jgi:hypothetical protein
LTQVLRKLANSGLPETKRAKRFALLYSKLTILRAKRANALAKTAHKLLPLKAQRTRRLCPLNAHCRLRLTQLTCLISKLTRKLLARKACLPRRLRNTCLCLCPLHS